jgi:transcriptional regulator with XRE-family HTH domain
MDENELNKTIAQNLCTLRKKSGLTQLQLAEKINYSDKAISKWEKGACLPSIYVLMTVAEFYGVTLQEIVGKDQIAEPKRGQKDIKTMVSLLSWATVWLIATIVFVVLRFISPVERAWLSFIVAIPASFLVCTIFSSVWKWRLPTAIFSSFFVWTAIMAISLMLKSPQVWLFYLIGIPLQFIIIFGTVLSFIRHRVKD